MLECYNKLGTDLKNINLCEKAKVSILDLVQTISAFPLVGEQADLDDALATQGFRFLDALENKNAKDQDPN